MRGREQANKEMLTRDDSLQCFKFKLSTDAQVAMSGGEVRPLSAGLCGRRGGSRSGCLQSTCSYKELD
jgi:hypothetical protein